MTDRDQEDRQYMQMALDMAKLGRGYTNPNPMVGAVIVKEGKVIARAIIIAAVRDMLRLRHLRMPVTRM